MLEFVIKKLLSIFYHGPMSQNKKSFLICCPWHEDKNPSCHIFKDSGVFRCWTCHGDSKGVDPYRGFQALGMPEFEAKQIFIRKQKIEEPLDFKAELPRIQDLRIQDLLVDEFEDPLELDGINEYIKALTWEIECSSERDAQEVWKQRKYLEDARDIIILWQEQNTLVASRREWEKTDGNNGNYRGILYETLKGKEFQDIYRPTVVKLETNEPEERLALRIGNSTYFEVFLRQKPDSVLKIKSINQKGLTFKPGQVESVAFPFGIKSWDFVNDSKGLFITEGPYDCLRTHQHILQNNLKYKALALLGTPNVEEIFDILERNILFKMYKKKIPLLLALDHDEAGMKATALFMKLYEEFFNEVDLKGKKMKDYIKIFPYPLGIGDPGDLEAKVFLNALNACV